MLAPLVTLTTDFGTGSGYVAQLKGVLFSAIPDCRIVDVCHEVPCHSIRHAEVLLRSTAFAFPLGTVHLVVVDPDVGTAGRRPIAVAARGHCFVGPDNGVLGVALAQPGATCVHLDRPHLFREPVSRTFHGRDVFAPVAAELAAGLPFELVGSPVFDALPSQLPIPRREADDVLVGEVLSADRFGNLASNIPWASVGPEDSIWVDGQRPKRVRTYGEAALGELVALCSSDGYVEIAMREASAALHLGAETGLEVRCQR